ncbi:putative non-LTR retroelement reverse transcriptase, partial [Trifolium medium]|nr:putative non-LTR retroelement reverse transcriptase [Trifolium medium]
KHDSHFSQPSNVAHHILQKPPEGQWIKLNTDGARKDMRRAGCGGLLRDSHGAWLGGFAKYLGNCYAYVAELWGVVEGLKYAWSRGFKKVELNVDSIAVVQVLNEGGTCSALGFSLVKQIQRLVNLDWEIKVSHLYREANQCADGLATMGCSLQGCTLYFEECPDQIKHLLEFDAMGYTTPRLIPL